MRVAVFSTKSYDRRFLDAANADGAHELVYLEARLSGETVATAAGAQAICAFVNDELDADTIGSLAGHGIGLVALRCAGFNNVDLAAAREAGIVVARVPAYSPQAVAEHTAALILTLNRKTHRAYARVREGNFALSGLLGFNLSGRTVGVVGTGRIGAAFAQIMQGFGCKVLAYDPQPDGECEKRGVRYVDLTDLLSDADIVSLHCPLTRETYHLIDGRALTRMREGVMLVNTSRGGVVDTRAVIKGLKSGRIGSLALDVYEEEADLFFENLSDRVIHDDVFARLLTFPNVLVTGHQAFFTEEALTEISETTIANISAFEKKGTAIHTVSIERLA